MNTLRTLLICTLVLVLSACSTSMSIPLDEQTNVKIPNNPNKAQIYFYREKAFESVLRGLYVTVDGRRVGGLNSGTYFVHEVSPGEHTLSVEDWLGNDPSRRITLHKGEKRYIKGSFQTGLWDTQPRLEIVVSEEGRTAIEGLTYGKLKTIQDSEPSSR